jgi:signal peptidase II
LNQKVKDYLVLIGVAGAVIALDQWTKWLVRENIDFGAQWLPKGMEWLSPYARIVHWYNSGAAFGMFQNGNLVFTILAFIVICAIIYYYPQVETQDWTLKLAMGLQLAGAAGNLIDRLIMGKVTDFISVGTFPVFNFADASISVGVVVLLLGVWIKERQEKKKAAELQVNSGQSSVVSEQLVVDSEKQEVNSEQS